MVPKARVRRRPRHTAKGVPMTIPEALQWRDVTWFWSQGSFNVSIGLPGRFLLDAEGSLHCRSLSGLLSGNLHTKWRLVYKYTVNPQACQQTFSTPDPTQTASILDPQHASKKFAGSGHCATSLRRSGSICRVPGFN